MGFLDALRSGLEKTRKSFTEKIEILVSGTQKIDDEFLEELEAVLIAADVGMPTTTRLLTDIRKSIKSGNINSPETLTPFLKSRINELLSAGISYPRLAGQPPTVIMVVGVNGVGKTTTIGKLGNYYHKNGLKVTFAAADTFRAAAIDQLEVWGQRIGADVIKHSEGSDPAAVAYDAVQAAKARHADVLIIDTAGRLHTKANLMEELKKLYRVIQREIPEAPHEILLVLDATTGQNAVNQAKIFNESTNVSGVVLTKLDGTAKGGVIVAIKAELGIPVKWVGVGEGIDDLQPFVPEAFVAALFGDK
jgi:fused signal recognition particle receptor